MAEKPEVILRNGKPAAVILDINVYEEILERLEDAADLRWLQKMRLLEKLMVFGRGGSARCLTARQI